MHISVFISLFSFLWGSVPQHCKLWRVWDWCLGKYWAKYSTKTIPQGRHGDSSQGSALRASQAWRGLLGNAKVATKDLFNCALWKQAASVRGNEGIQALGVTPVELRDLHWSSSTAAVYRKPGPCILSLLPHKKSAAGWNQAGWKELLHFEQSSHLELLQLCLRVFAVGETFSSESCWEEQPWGDVLKWFQAAGALKDTAQVRCTRGSVAVGSTAWARWAIPTWELPSPGTMSSLSAAFLVQLFPHPITLSQHHSACCCDIGKDTNHRAGNKKRDDFSPQQRKLLVKLPNEDPGKEWQRREGKALEGV